MDVIKTEISLNCLVKSVRGAKKTKFQHHQQWTAPSLNCTGQTSEEQTLHLVSIQDAKFLETICNKGMDVLNTLQPLARLYTFSTLVAGKE